jgi:hypothetical protein
MACTECPTVWEFSSRHDRVATSKFDLRFTRSGNAAAR